MKLSAVTTAIDLEYVEDVHCQASLPTSSQHCCQYANTTSQHCHLSESLNCDADTWHHKSLRMLHTTLPLCCSMKCTFVSLKYYVSQHRSKHELLMTWASFRLNHSSLNLWKLPANSSAFVHTQNPSTIAWMKFHVFCNPFSMQTDHFV